VNEVLATTTRDGITRTVRFTVRSAVYNVHSNSMSEFSQFYAIIYLSQTQAINNANEAHLSAAASTPPVSVVVEMNIIKVALSHSAAGPPYSQTQSVLVARQVTVRRW